MKHNNGLQLRVTLAMLSLVVLCNSIFAVVIFIGNNQFEEKLLDTQLTFEINEFVNKLEKFGATPYPLSASMNIYLETHKEITPIPDTFKKEPGLYHNIKHSNKTYHLAIQDTENDRLYLARDITDLEKHEGKLVLLLLFGATLTPILIIWLGIWLSRKVLSPVSQLAKFVSNLNPRDRNIRINPKFNGYEVETIAEAFDRYLEQMDEFVEREQSFSAAASHELRTPLSVISTSSELICKDPTLPDHLKPQANKIMRATKKMSDLVSAFLFLAREPSSDQSIYSECNLCDILKNTVEDHRHTINENTITLSVQCDKNTHISAVSSHISIVIGNLLQNAIFHTQSGMITAQLKNNRISIQDTGSGIAPKDIENIFTHQYRGQRSQGYGLGLYIAKNICDRYGWQLSLTSSPRAGTTAKIEF